MSEESQATGANGQESQSESMSPELASMCHVTWKATDVERTRNFLTTLFGWSFAPQSENYLVFEAQSGAWVGLTQVERIDRGAPFLPQISVADLGAVLMQAQKLGDIVEDEGEIAGVARYADLRDPDGTLFSVLQFTRCGA
jgi:predicted enzyme related to lactoylglutathione lyase